MDADQIGSNPWYACKSVAVFLGRRINRDSRI
jgi:hypothetical protein